MSGTPVKAVLDTNILVDYLRGLEEARQELARHERPAISLVTWMEVLVGARSQQEGTKLRAFLDRFNNRVLPAVVRESRPSEHYDAR
jgi:predicted nucleic acid-binding protein